MKGPYWKNCHKYSLCIIRKLGGAENISQDVKYLLFLYQSQLECKYTF